MNKKLNGMITTWLVVAALLLAFPKTVFADGGEGGTEKEVNGYHITLIFPEPIKTGENQFHIQITDSMGMPVTNAEVEVSAMPAEGMSEHDENEEMATEVPSTGVMTSNSDGMDMESEAPATGVMQPNEPAADEHGEEVSKVMLEPTMESGEYAGELHFDASGEWMFNVHFTVNGETTEVDFPVEIARTLGLNYAVLTGFFAINAAAIIVAATLKRKTVVVRK
ncbi:MAG: FixH family protein [Chloroflexi bacterium]|nr:FixH family protein [Chloroflexota bacterium]